jgi:glycosyltransferase involved in cell wall biosynthesis
VSGSLVSCIVPVFNGERYLGQTLESVFAQTYRPLELIVVDDGSTDRTPDVIAGYARRLRWVPQPNAGPAAARNSGLRESFGTFVAFLDQDDRWHPAKLARQMARFAARPELDVSVAHVASFWDTESGGENPRSPDQPRGGTVPGYVTGALLARRAVFERVGSFDVGLTYCDSLDWFIRAAERGVIVELLPDVLLYHRVHHGNLSRHGRESRAECLRILKRTLDRRRSTAATSR